MKATGLIVGALVGIGIGYVINETLVSGPKIKKLATDIEILEARADSLEVEIRESISIPIMPPESVRPISQEDAVRYLENYSEWVSEHGERSNISGYNVNTNILEATSRVIRDWDTDELVGGVRGMFGLSERVDSPDLPDGVMKVIVFPMNSRGERLELPSGFNLYVADLDFKYVRPCPPLCD